MLHLPVKTYDWIWLFGNSKSHDHTEGADEADLGKPKKEKISDPVSVEAAALSNSKGKNQYDTYLQTMERTTCFENQRVGYISFEAIENCVFEFAGYGFGAFLQNALLNKQHYQ